MTARLYLTVYAANDLPTEAAHVTSKSLGTVNTCTELEYKHVLHGSGALKAKISRHHPQAALLKKDRYVIVHSDAGPVGGAFLDEGTIDLSADEGKGDEWMVWTGRGAMGVTDRGAMDADSNISGGHDPIDGFWDLDEQGPLAGNENAHPIPMAKRVLNEVQLNTPNGIPVVDHSSWTYTTDSAGATVPFVTGDFGADVGESVYDLLAQMSQIGGVTWQMTHLFDLHAYLSYGTNRSGAFGVSTVRLEKGVNVAASIQRKVRGAVERTHLIVGGAERTFVTVTDPAYVAGDVVRWGFLSVPESADSAVLTEAGLAHIELRKRQTDVFVLPLHDHGSDPANGIYEPAPSGGHFWVGDTVSVHTGIGEYDANEDTAPVAAITWQLKTGDEANGDYAVIVEIGSTFHWDGAKVFAGAAPGSQHRVLLCQPHIAAAPTLVSSGGEVFSNDANREFPVTVGSQQDRALYAAILVHPATTPTMTWYPDGVLTPGTGQAMTQIATVTHASAMKMVLFRLLNPTAGAGEIGVSSVATAQGVAWWFLSGVHQVTPEADTDTATGTGTASAITSVPGANAVVLDAAGWGNNDLNPSANPTAGAGQTVDIAGFFNDSSGLHDVQFGGSHGSSTPSWTWDGSRNWCAVAVAVAGTGSASAGDGHADLVGTGSRASRCDHAHHVLRTTDPTVNDDADDGYPATTLWTNTATGNSFLLTDNTAGAAVWDAFGAGVTDHGALTGLGDDDHSQYMLDADHTEAAHTAMAGLATQAELDAHAATPHGGSLEPIGFPDGTILVTADGSPVMVEV